MVQNEILEDKDIDDDSSDRDIFSRIFNNPIVMKQLVEPEQTKKEPTSLQNKFEQTYQQLKETIEKN